MSHATPQQATPPLLTPFTLPPAHLPTLEQAVAAQGNAVMLTGAAYGGKANLALAVFAAFNCTGPRGMAGEACGECTSCRALVAQAHPDLLHLRPKDKTREGKQARSKIIPLPAILKSKDTSREYEQHVFEFLELPPQHSRRLIIINRAEHLNSSAANALLKLIEEPPHGARFILLTEDVQAVIPTIVSRSTRLRVPPLTAADLQQLSANIAPTLLEFAAGRPEVLGHATAIETALANANAFVDSAHMGMLPALEAAGALESSWDEWHPQAIRFVWKSEALAQRAALDSALTKLEAALQGYANPSLTFMNFALEVRRILGKA